MMRASQRPAWPVYLVGIFGALLIILMARSVIGHAPLYDELLHVLAARGWLAEGAPVIADGIYSRAWLYTGAVAASLSAFGDTLVVARLPSLVAAALLVASLGMWIARRVGWQAGLFAAGALCLLPETLRLAVFVRFYTTHALLVLGMAVLVFAATGSGKSVRARVLPGVVAALLLPFAWHLQPTTAIAVVSILAAGAAVLVMDHQAWVVAQLRGHPLMYGVAVVVAAVVGALVLTKLGFIEAFREVPVWAAWAADAKHYYIVQFTRNAPLLWPLLPVATIFAFMADRRLAVFCVVVVVFALGVHSLAAAKHMRYVYYVLPFMAALLGLGVAGAIDMVRGVRARYAALATLCCALVLSQEGQMTVRLLAGRAAMLEALPYTVEPDWGPATAPLRPLAEAADQVITSNAMKALYYLGRYDYELNASIVAETDTGAEFGMDGRTGRRAISVPASLNKVLDNPGRTVVVLEEETMNSEAGVTSAAVAIIESRCSAARVVPEGVAIRAWICQEMAGVESG